MVQVEVYTEELLLQQLNKSEVQKLAEDFKCYKENASGNLLGFNIGNPNFGKDEHLTQPPQIRGILSKVHFKPNTPKDAVRKWSRAIQRGDTPTSDHILIYCSGKKNKNAYLIIDLFRPNGHEMMRNFPRLNELKVNFADPFRKEF
ncbi:type II toxin-antitoxin system YafO family toxin [Vibrio vulnificus]|nr:type II toxin-antitoxin system YafO family toxin [Vibrio vulnificus]